jgi:tetratricopeptide (TPR) repeat protein
MIRLLYLFLFIALISCSHEQAKDEAITPKDDSLAKILNDPELKAINTKLLEQPENADLYHQRAIVYFHLKEFQPAVNDSKRAIRIDSTKAEYYNTLVDVYFSQNNTRLAKELLEIIEKKFPENTDALLKLAELYWLVRQYQKAIDYVNKALKIDEHIARGYYIKGGIYRESGDTTRAVSSLETATEQDNDFVDAYYDLGVIFSARRNPVGLQYFDNVLRIDPKHEDARYGRAKLLQDLGKIQEAIAEYESILKSDEKCARCHYNLGAIMLEIVKDNKSAVSHFTEAIRIEPANPQTYFARGYTYTKMKDIESAKADYKMCLKLAPDFEPALQGLNTLEGTK